MAINPVVKQSTQPYTVSRRALLQAGLAAWLLPAGQRLAWGAQAKAKGKALLCAAYQTPQGDHCVGLFAPDVQSPLEPATSPAITPQGNLVASHALPGRPHGITVAPDGARVIITARRPGDWMAIWSPLAGEFHVVWNEAASSLNGHLLFVPNGGLTTVWTTETDRISGEGRLVRRDANTLAEIDTVDAHGPDGHELLYLPNGLPGHATGLAVQPCVLVANGGQHVNPLKGREVERDKPLQSSLVLLSATDGVLLDTWRLDDPWLSLRHMAVGNDGLVAVALQAKHPDTSAHTQAPVVAVLQQGVLACPPKQCQPSFDGYAGSMVATEFGFVVTGPKADAAALLNPKGEVMTQIPWAKACAGAYGVGMLWLARDNANQFDNHAVTYPLAHT